MSSLEFFAIFFAGTAACGFGTMIGFGGGIFMVPILTIGFDVPIPLAIGACSVALFPSSLISTIGNLRQRLVDLPVVGLLEIPTMLGVVVGAQLTAVLPVKILEVIFSVFVLFLAYRMFQGSKVPGTNRNLIARLNWLGPRLKCRSGDHDYSVGYMAATVFGSISGVLAGLFGIGGGFLKIPVMLGVFGMPARVAVATALCGIVLTSLTASVSHALLGNITYVYSVPTVLGFVAGALVGNLYLKKRFQHIEIRWLITGGLTLAGVSVFLDAILA